MATTTGPPVLDQRLAQEVTCIKSRNRDGREGRHVMCGCPLVFLIGTDATTNKSGATEESLVFISPLAFILLRISMRQCRQSSSPSSTYRHAALRRNNKWRPKQYFGTVKSVVRVFGERSGSDRLRAETPG